MLLVRCMGLTLSSVEHGHTYASRWSPSSAPVNSQIIPGRLHRDVMELWPSCVLSCSSSGSATLITYVMGKRTNHLNHAENLSKSLSNYTSLWVESLLITPKCLPDIGSKLHISKTCIYSLLYIILTSLLINGSNHWVLCRPDQVYKSDPWPGGHEVLFAATSDHFPSHPTNKDGRATDSSVAYWWLGPDDWLLLYPPQVKHLWFQQKQVETNSQTVLAHSVGIIIMMMTPTERASGPSTLQITPNSAKWNQFCEHSIAVIGPRELMQQGRALEWMQFLLCI